MNEFVDTFPTSNSSAPLPQGQIYCKFQLDRRMAETPDAYRALWEPEGRLTDGQIHHAFMGDVVFAVHPQESGMTALGKRFRGEATYPTVKARASINGVLRGTKIKVIGFAPVDLQADGGQNYNDVALTGDVQVHLIERADANQKLVWDWPTEEELKDPKNFRPCDATRNGRITLILRPLTDFVDTMFDLAEDGLVDEIPNENMKQSFKAYRYKALYDAFQGAVDGDERKESYRNLRLCQSRLYEEANSMVIARTLHPCEAHRDVNVAITLAS